MHMFECPHCSGKEFSSWASREDEIVTCVYCGKQYQNPHFSPFFGRRKMNEVTDIKTAKLQGN